MADPEVEQVHFIGKDIVYPVLAGDAALQRPQDADQRLRARFHHAAREKMKSRARHLAAAVPRARHGRRVAALLHRRQAQCARRGHRLQPEDFVARVNSDLVGKLVNIASRAASFPAQALRRPVRGDAGRLVRLQGEQVEGAAVPALHAAQDAVVDIGALYEAREFGKVVREVMSPPTRRTNTSTARSPGCSP